MVVIMDGGVFRCTNCGTTHNPFANGQGVELWAMTSLADGFQKKHVDCPDPEGPRCFFCNSPEHIDDQHVNATTTCPEDWLNCGDTGISSRAIWAQMMWKTPRFGSSNGHPLDPSDLGRCLRLLAAPWAVGWRERLPEMAAHGPEWARLVAVWDELAALYAEEKTEGTGKAPKLYQRMTEILRG